MKRAIIDPRNAILFALFLVGCMSNTVVDENNETSTLGRAVEDDTPSEVIINIAVEIDTLYHKDFTFEGSPVVEIKSSEGEVTKVEEYKFTLPAQPSSSCTVVVSDINIPLANTYDATVYCAITTFAYMYSGEEYDVVISFNHNSIDNNGVAILPAPILFNASVVDWDTY